MSAQPSFKPGEIYASRDDLILLGDEPVTDEERENAEVALDPSKLEEREGVWSRLSGSSGDASDPPANGHSHASLG
jgi:hypothetical protein